MPGSPYDRGVAVARRNADHDVARFDQGQMGCHRRAGQPIEHGDIVGLWGAAQVFKRQRLERLKTQRWRDFVDSVG